MQDYSISRSINQFSTKSPLGNLDQKLDCNFIQFRDLAVEGLSKALKIENLRLFTNELLEEMSKLGFDLSTRSLANILNLSLEMSRDFLTETTGFDEEGELKGEVADNDYNLPLIGFSLEYRFGTQSVKDLLTKEKTKEHDGLRNRYVYIIGIMFATIIRYHHENFDLYIDRLFTQGDKINLTDVELNGDKFYNRLKEELEKRYENKQRPSDGDPLKLPIRSLPSNAAKFFRSQEKPSSKVLLAVYNVFKDLHLPQVMSD